MRIVSLEGNLPEVFQKSAATRRFRVQSDGRATQRRRATTDATHLVEQRTRVVWVRRRAEHGPVGG